MTYLVFISYSTKDMERVQQVRRALQDSQIEVFIAEHSVRPGERLLDAILDAISRCDVFVLLWSKNSEESRWVPQELGAAAANDKLIIPIVLDEDLSLPAFVADRKYIPAYRDPVEAFDALRAEVLQRAKPIPDASPFVMLGILIIILLILYKGPDPPAA